MALGLGVHKVVYSGGVSLTPHIPISFILEEELIQY